MPHDIESVGSVTWEHRDGARFGETWRATTIVATADYVWADYFCVPEKEAMANAEAALHRAVRNIWDAA